MQKETYLEPDIWAASMQVCVFCCYWHLLLSCSQKASGCSRASTVECCHMLITADPLPLLCKHVREECVCVCVCTCMFFLSVSDTCSARSKSFSRSETALLSLSALLTASSCCCSKICVVLRRSSSPRFPAPPRVKHVRSFKSGF